MAYLMTETSGDMLLSGVAAAGMGAVIYAGWEVAFNHCGWGKRLAALAVASTFAVLSSWTVYQHNYQPLLVEAKATRAAAQQREDAARDAASRLLEKARSQLEKQQADITNSIESLRRQNEEALADISAITAPGGKNAAWQAGQIRKGMDTRNTQLTTLTGQSLEVSKQLSGLAKSAGKVTPTEVAGSEALPLPALSWPMLARASLYEVITALFLLFGSWFRQDAQHKTQGQVKTLAGAQAEHDAAYDRLQAAIHAANTAAAAHARAIQEAGADAADHAQAATAAAADAKAQTQAAKDAATAAHAACEPANQTARQLGLAVDAANQVVASAEVSTHRANAAAEAATAAADSAAGLDEKLQATVIHCNKAIAHIDKSVLGVTGSVLGVTGSVLGKTGNPPKSVLGDTDSVLGDTETKTDKIKLKLVTIDINDVLLLLKNKRIEEDNKGLITPEAIMAATGWGRPKSRESLVSAFDAEIIARKQHGNGYVYMYKPETSVGTSGLLVLETPQNPTKNVVSINQARSH
jgi:hypothetical protein